LIRVLVQELGELVLGFTVYNPDKKEIIEFTIYILLNEKKFIKNHELLCENSINNIEYL
tara:strand:+ start:1901 stop:2077 length:177 start_codon:yes stop_codon:yes gene_type:complete